MTSAASTTCTIPEELISSFKKFKVAKNQSNSAYIMKINPKALIVELEEQKDGVTLEELAEELPESAPRYIAYSYKYTHKDGRISYPLVFLYFVPPATSPQLSMLGQEHGLTRHYSYASTKQRLVQALECQKDFEVRNVSDLTEVWLKQKLGLSE